MIHFFPFAGESTDDLLFLLFYFMLSLFLCVYIYIYIYIFLLFLLLYSCFFILFYRYIYIFFCFVLQTGMQSTVPCTTCAPWSRLATVTMANTTPPQHCCLPLSLASSLTLLLATTVWLTSSPDTTTVTMHSTISSECC